VPLHGGPNFAITPFAFLPQPGSHLSGGPEGAGSNFWRSARGSVFGRAQTDCNHWNQFRFCRRLGVRGLTLRASKHGRTVQIKYVPHPWLVIGSKTGVSKCLDDGWRPSLGMGARSDWQTQMPLGSVHGVTQDMLQRTQIRRTRTRFCRHPICISPQDMVEWV